MNLTIDIPDEDYERLKWTTIGKTASEHAEKLRSYILNGTPVQEGEWVENTRYKRKGKRFYDCSNCHYGEHGDVMCEVQTLPKYCPNCGAKMKGEE